MGRLLSRGSHVLVATGVIAAAALALAGVFAWQSHRLGAETARKEARVRQALPIVELAVKAGLADVEARARAETLRGRQRRDREGLRELRNPEPPRPSYHMVTAVRAEPASGQLLGADFTWRGTAYRWPANPFTGRPMTLGTGPGDFTCEVTWWGSVSGTPDSYRLVAYGSSGKPILTLTVVSHPAVPIE